MTIVLDGVGGRLGRDALELIGPGGRLLIFGWSSGRILPLSAADLYRLEITAGAAIGRRVLGRLRKLEETAPAAGRLIPLIGAPFPPAEAARAHIALETRATTGKSCSSPDQHRYSQCMAERGDGALALLRANPAFRALSISRVVSFVGDSVSLVALMLHVAGSAGAALAVSLLLLVGDFAPALVSPLTGAIGDRFNRKHVMIVCELAQGALLLLIALALPPLPLLLALVAVRSTIGQTFQPASRAAIPELVAGKDLAVANSTIGFGANGAEAVGPFIAAALFPILGVRGVLLVDATSFLLSALVLTSVRSLPPATTGDEARQPFLADARVGLGYIASVPAVRIIALTFCAVVMFNGIDDVAIVYLVKDTLVAPEWTVGLILGGVGIGLLAGYVVLARHSRLAPMTVLLLVGYAVSSVGNLLTGVAWAVAAALLLQTVRGLGLAAMDVAGNTLLQRLVPGRLLGRVFGNFYGLIGVAAAVSYVGGGLLLDATGAPVTFVVAGTGGALATIIAALTLPRALRRTGKPLGVLDSRPRLHQSPE
ncbi:MAG TPA: MFS transporter [Actinophytocola sp.]|uniref:MFS transporter n=1 Tax=Actinophytocola sp. TaxID=1872138 RepID=UPI002DDD2637|nr:MFS transporter [Actinophytocola sp.]HEV2783776.1 MFS transporter [Actinophytocola sp.]